MDSEFGSDITATVMPGSRGNAAADGGGAYSSPLIIEPRTSRLDVFRWAEDRKDVLARRLRVSGAILFRGFKQLASPSDLATFGSLVTENWIPYQDRASKRTHVNGPVYTSTETSKEFTIPLHNESSFTSRWPRRIFFFCTDPARHGGRTPIADVRKVYMRIDSGVRADFEDKGVLYRRNFGQAPGMGWQEVFQVESKSELEIYCRSAAIELEWLSNGCARTSQVRPAALEHPETNEPLWFNHAYPLHISTLGPALRETCLRQYGEAGLPHNTYYGDGEAIPDSVIEHIKQAYNSEAMAFDWVKGDLLMLDNMLVAHGREPYEGHRRILTAMADPVSWTELGIELAMPMTQTSQSDCSSESIEDLKDTQETRAPMDSDQFKRYFFRLVADELNVDRVNPSDTFSTLGGDSFSAAVIIGDMMDELGIDVPMETFFDSESLASLAESLEQQLRHS